MYATSHRIRGKDGAEATHSFVHEHGRVDWPVEVFHWPERNPGTLRLSKHSLAVGGNRVLAYIDVLCPDRTELPEVKKAIESISGDFSSQNNQLVKCCGTVTIRFGLEEEVIGSWRSQLALLSAEALEIIGEFHEHIGLS